MWKKLLIVNKENNICKNALFMLSEFKMRKSKTVWQNNSHTTNIKINSFGYKVIHFFFKPVTQFDFIYR